MWILLEAEDVLLFRDSRPFSAGEDFRAEGQFPPLPPPVAGAIRSALMAAVLTPRGKTFSDLPALPEVTDLLGHPTSMGQVNLAGPLMCWYAPGKFAVEDRQPEPVFALPAGILPGGIPRLRDDWETPGKRRAMPGGLANGFSAVLGSSSHAARPVGQAEMDNTEASEVAGEWLRSAELGKYLMGGSAVSRETLAAPPEVRTGIQRSASRTVQPSRIYTAQMHRPHWDRNRAVGLLVRLELPDAYWSLASADAGAGDPHPAERDQFPAQYASLGGEGRRVFLRPLPSLAPALETLAFRAAVARRILADDGRFRLYLATPSIFQQGLLPTQFPDGMELRGLASGKPASVGGWNLAANSPRSLRRAVPAGTVYFGKLRTPSAAAVEELLRTYHFQTVLQAQDADDDALFHAQMGFGLTLVGAWTQTFQGIDAASREEK